MVSHPPSPTSSSTLSLIDTSPASPQVSSQPPSPPSPTTKRPLRKSPDRVISEQAGSNPKSRSLNRSLSPSSGIQRSRAGSETQRASPGSSSTPSSTDRRRSSARTKPVSSTISEDLNGSRLKEQKRHDHASRRESHTSHGLGEGSSRTATESKSRSSDVTASNVKRKKSTGLLGRMGGDSPSRNLPSSHPFASTSGSLSYTRHSSNPPPVPSTFSNRDQPSSSRSASQALQPPIALSTSSINGRFSIPFQSTSLRSYNPPSRQSSLPVGLNTETLPFNRASIPGGYTTGRSPYMVYQSGREDVAVKDIERTLEKWSFDSVVPEEINGNNGRDNRVRKPSAQESDVSSHRTGGTNSDELSPENSRKPSWSSINTSSTHTLPSLLDSSPFIDINDLHSLSPLLVDLPPSTVTAEPSSSQQASLASLYGPFLDLKETSASPDTIHPPTSTSSSSSTQPYLPKVSPSKSKKVPAPLTIHVPPSKDLPLVESSDKPSRPKLFTLSSSSSSIHHVSTQSDVTPPSASIPSPSLHRRVMSTGSTPPAVPAKNPLRQRSGSGMSTSTRSSPIMGYPSSPSFGSIESFQTNSVTSPTEERSQDERNGEENEDTIRYEPQKASTVDQSLGAQWKSRGDLERSRSQISTKDSFWLDEEDEPTAKGKKRLRRVGLDDGIPVLTELTKQTPPVRLEAEPVQTQRLPSTSASLPQSRQPSTTAVNDHTISSPTYSRSSRPQSTSVYSTHSETSSPPSSYNRYVFQPLHSPVLSFPPDKDSVPTSKRAHLLSEIRTTERSYAQDLAVVRDVYIHRIQPSSTFSIQNQHPEDTAASESQTTFPSAGGSRRSSMATFETGQTSLIDAAGGSVDDGGSLADRTSKHSISLFPIRPLSSSSGISLSTNGGHPSPQPLRSPASQRSMRSNTSSSYFPSLTSPKVPMKPATSPSPSTMTASFGGETTAKPPSTAELRTIFLNLDTLAVLADDFASILEDVCGTTAQAEGWDMVGEAFLNMMPRIKQAFTLYCPRQAVANSRLLEIQSNKRYTPYFTECWTLVQPFTSSWDLPSMLIKPVQRLLKYPLLLDDLLKCTPLSHPDYSKIKQASLDIRNLADEINEIKRRKDTVSSVMRKDKESAVISASHPQSSVSKEHGGKFKKGGVMTAFRKDKAPVPTTIGAASTSLFTIASHEQLRKTEQEYAMLVNRLISAEKTGKRMDGLMNGLASKVKDTWLAQMQIIEDWKRMINLQGIESLEDIRVEAYTDTVIQILEGPCRRFESELRKSILPAVSKLSSMCEGPRTIILKRNAKHEDYNKVTAAKARGSDADKFPQDVINGAEIFIALHHQLLAELPLLLDGFATILDLVVRSLTECQARYYRGVHALLSCFWAEYPPVIPDPEGVNVSSGGPAIIRVWEEASAPPREMMEALNITKKISVRLLDAPVRIATGSHYSNLRRKQSYSSSRSSNISSTALSTPNSVSSNRARSSSLSTLARPNPATMDHPPMPNASEDTLARNSMFNLRKKPSQRGRLDRAEGERGSSHNLGVFSAVDTQPHISNRSDTAIHLISDRRSISSANSFGPALSAMSFEGSESSHFGESVIQGITSVHATPSPKKHVSLPHLSPASHRSIDPRSPSFAERSFNQTEEEEGLGETPTKLNLTGSKRPASEEREEVLYKCQCVAEFDLRGIELSFMGNPFLRIKRGDIIDIVEEVGRVDELPDHFPLDVGLEDDGLLLGISSTGQKGFVLCSFLNPLF